MNRKEFLIKTGAFCLGASVLPIVSFNNASGKKSRQGEPFTLPKLGFAYSALESAIDALTMEIHYSKHHAGYVKKLNVALEKHPLRDYDIVDICKNITTKDSDAAVLNNGGGHYNHSLFWEILQPGGASEPRGKLLNRINRDFGSFTAFREEFSKAAATVFGSGWAWLISDNKGRLAVISTQNQENPLMENVVEKSGIPILGIDVWEHAYYLHYQNRRGDYIKNFMSLINWDVVAAKYSDIGY